MSCDAFCLIHGYEHMKKDPFDPIARCEACEAEQAGKPITIWSVSWSAASDDEIAPGVENISSVQRPN